jgi:hypothetical protein
MKIFQMLFIICALSAAAVAGPVTWYVDVTFSDGGGAFGTFVFNADSGTACSTTNSPCGTYSNVDVVTTTGSSLSGVTYNTVCGVGGDTSCAGVSPDSTEVMFLTSGAADQTGDQAIAFFFLAPGPVPPSGLSDAGGTYDVSNTTAGVVQESFCIDAACDNPTGNSRVSVEGTVSSTSPEPSTALLLAAPLAMLGLVRFAKRGRRA